MFVREQILLVVIQLLPPLKQLQTTNNSSCRLSTRAEQLERMRYTGDPSFLSIKLGLR